MQKLWLKDFEYHIAAATREAAEALLRARAVQQLQEVERHFWVAVVTDGDQQVEAEVIITPGKIKAFACECWEEGRRLMCPHIAAALFKIRQYLNQKAQERQAQIQNAEEARARRLTVDNILANTAASELADFVRQYAERDNTFTLALKAHFAGKIANAEEHYTAVLRAALPGGSRAIPLKPAEVRRARLALDTLMAQINSDNTLAAFHMSLAVLHYLAERTALAEPPQQDWLLGYCQRALHYLTQSGSLAPEQRERVQLFLTDLFYQAPYPQALVTDTLRFLAQAARDENYYQRIRQLFDQAIYPIATPVLLLFGAALAERGQYDLLSRVLEAHFDEPDRVVTVLETLVRLNYTAAVLPAGMTLWKQERLPFGRQVALENLLLEAAVAAGDIATQTALLHRRFQRQGDAHTLERLRQISADQWPAEREHLLAQLRTQKANDRAAMLLAYEGDLGALAALMRENADLNALQHYEHLLLPQWTDFVRDTYVDALGRYLDEHFGKQAADHVREYLAALVKRGQATLAAQIAQALIDRFAERLYLPEELAESFPKGSRPTFVIPNLSNA